MVESCDGSVLSWCNTQTGKCTQRDCSSENALCQIVDAGQAQCVPPPPPPCDQTYVTHCEGDFLLYCDFSSGGATGQVTSVDCFDLYAGYYTPGWCYDAGGGNATCEYGN